MITPSPSERGADSLTCKSSLLSIWAMKNSVRFQIPVAHLMKVITVWWFLEGVYVVHFEGENGDFGCVKPLCLLKSSKILWQLQASLFEASVNITGFSFDYQKKYVILHEKVLLLWVFCHWGVSAICFY